VKPEAVLSADSGVAAAAIRLRPAEVADVAAIVMLSAPAVAAGTLVARDATVISSAIKDFILVEAEGAVSAAVGLSRRGQDLLIYNFCVIAALRGRGVGAYLVEQAVTRALAEGCGAVIAFAPPRDTWFPRRGFRRLDDCDLAPSRARLRTPGRRSALFERPVGASSAAC
jgi:N-acetylglutamate synthase-like GNAT family acetyltransferase